ncbi:hypothetical protein [uncultured Desulfovibrio sp.]|uniref:hypothetical protein n=1 Tax=uncultured Desulfovibrio sp. TaxID=167968 RepID=UPI002602CA67|nr:hypothetical protein [uncultured Desulfovibrio sp.]
MGWMEFFLIAAIALPAACLLLLMKLQWDIQALLRFLEREAERDEAQAREKNGKPMKSNLHEWNGSVLSLRFP